MAAASARRSSSSGHCARCTPVSGSKRHAAGIAQRPQIAFLVKRAGCDQDAVGADAEPCGPQFGVGDDFAGKPLADAVDFAEAVVAGGSVRLRPMPGLKGRLSERIEGRAAGGSAKNAPGAA